LPDALQYISSTDTPASINGNDISWDLGTMQPFESRNFQVQVLLDASTPIGEIIASSANVAPVVDDEMPSNNQYELREEVIGSFDPNDKTVEPMEYITPAQVAAGQPLIYTIRFQNTGNYLAENVRILDTLSTKLDLSTVQVLSSSHPVEWFVRNGRLLEFVFENIFLPDSISNEPASHGFVKFSIKPKANLALGEGIDNKADIYFDFNAPVRTNTASISIDNGSLTVEKENGHDLKVSPNPNTGNFKLTLPNALESAGDLQIMDGQGKIQYHCKWGSGQQSMNMKLSSLSAGSYFIQLKSGQKTWVTKVLVVN
jgi:fimbrial isopeptide formation D2 family protein